MASREDIKNEIRLSLMAFEPKITVRGRGGEGIFDEVLEENPALMFYIQSMRWRSSAIGFEQSILYTIEYCNTEIPYNSISLAKSTADVERILHQSMEKFCPCAVVCAPSSVDTVKAYNDFMVSYGGFYSNLMELGYECKSFTGKRMNFTVFRFVYRIGRVKLNMMERSVDEEVERLGGILFTRAMKPETKAYIAHNYLARTVEYWIKEDANPLEKSYMQSAYGAFINHRCVCQGYAEAYKRLLDSQGIECQVICGKIKGSLEYHAWNAISFDGKNYYHVDVTWDSLGGGTVGWDYFCKTDDEMKPTRIWSRIDGVYCNSRENIKAVARGQIAFEKASYISAGVDKKYL